MADGNMSMVFDDFTGLSYFDFTNKNQDTKSFKSDCFGYHDRILNNLILNDKERFEEIALYVTDPESKLLLEKNLIDKDQKSDDLSVRRFSVYASVTCIVQRIQIELFDKINKDFPKIFREFMSQQTLQLSLILKARLILQNKIMHALNKTPGTNK